MSQPGIRCVQPDHGENGSGATSAGRRTGSSRELPTRLTTPADSAPRIARLRASQVRVSQPEDVAERDADRAADLIAPGAAAGRGASRSPLAYAPPVVWDAIDSPGRLLDGHERPSALGIDLAAVRLHEGGLADRSARALEAAAYTVGDDIVVGDGYDSHSAAGRRLLVHELTHVAQQRRLMFAAHDPAPGSGVSGLVAARQPLPARGAPGADPDEERARRLSRLLRDSPEAALTELKALSETELDALDDKAAKVLRGADASLVHRGVEFVLYWRAHNQPAAKSGDMPKPDEEGVSAPKADATVSGGTVAVRVGAGGGSGLGYTLTYTTSTPNTVADARWLQFAWREVVVERSVKGSRSPSRRPLEKRIGRPFGGSLFQYLADDRPGSPELEYRHVREKLAVLRGKHRHSDADEHHAGDVRQTDRSDRARQTGLRRRPRSPSPCRRAFPRRGLPRARNERALPRRDRPLTAVSEPGRRTQTGSHGQGRACRTRSRPSTGHDCSGSSPTSTTCRAQRCRRRT